MWKFVVFLFLIGSTAAQDPIQLSCQFIDSVFGDYICRFVGIDVTNPGQPVNIGGEHPAGRSNADVTVVQIRNSNTPFVIQQIFTTFPNLIELDIQNSNLQELQLSPEVQLEYLVLYRNNLTVIRNGTFAGQSKLEFIEAMDNRIEEIERDAFVGLDNVYGLLFIGNRISSLLPGVFRSLTNLVYLDFEQNRLQRIEDDVFTGLVNLESLYLEFNQINAVSTVFTNGFGPNFQYLNFVGNRCIDRPFVIREPIDVILINNALQLCFNNYVGDGIPERRRITLEFVGPLQLFDEFGNIIARVE